MCTLVIAWNVLADAPIAVAANRDEALDRPSSSPTVRAGDPVVVAPRDERAGGTWIGYNEAGVFAGISNRWTDQELRSGRSRGLLVDDVLSYTDARTAARAVEEAVSAAEYAGFNLLVADADAAILFEWDGTLGVREFEPGVHVVMNAGYDEAFRTVTDRAEAARSQAENAVKVRETLEVRPDETAEEWVDRAGGVLGDHDFGVCVHGVGFGTRSSSLITLRSDGTATYRFADGPPCETPHGPVAVDPDKRQS